MATITWADKSTGDQFTAAECNEIKDVVNTNAALAGGGGNIQRVVANYTASVSDVVLADATSTAITVTIGSVSSGGVVTVKKTDASGNLVTVIGGSGQTIDGNASIIISSQFTSVTFICDGIDWHII